METAIINFWSYFISIQNDLINVENGKEFNQRKILFDKLSALALHIHPKMEIILHFKFKDNYSAILIFLTKGNYRLKAIAEISVSLAPKNENWRYHAGLRPYKHSVIRLCAHYKFIDPYTSVYQIFFAIQKIYRTSNKLQLLIYLETDKQHSKQILHQAMDKILLWFLGDSLYYNHISRFKILRRKYVAKRFIHLDELKASLQLRHFN